MLTFKDALAFLAIGLFVTAFSTWAPLVAALTH